MELWKRFTKLADKYRYIVFTNDDYFSVNSATKITSLKNNIKIFVINHTKITIGLTSGIFGLWL